jgi:hypothetical protein
MTERLRRPCLNRAGEPCTLQEKLAENWTESVRSYRAWVARMRQPRRAEDR